MEEALDKMARLLSGELTLEEYGGAKEMLISAMKAGKLLLMERSRATFVRNLAKVLRRRGLLAQEDVEKFCEYGYEYMKLG